MALELELELFFRPSDLQKLTDAPGVKSIIVGVKVLPSDFPTDGSAGLLVAYAKGYDGSKNQIEVNGVPFEALGCPTPCKPGGTFDCGDEAEATLKKFESSGVLNSIR
ncbi:MAG: hypothetical protein KGO82_00210 [Bacteroidota bacterium]|nr:hypothetical protein [Bacteroidota bacterium]